jgi:hypothetical protein
VGGKGEGSIREGVEWTKQSILTAGMHQETLLKIDLEINNEGQDCKVGTVCVGEYLWEGLTVSGV